MFIFNILDENISPMTGALCFLEYSLSIPYVSWVSGKSKYVYKTEIVVNRIKVLAFQISQLYYREPWDGISFQTMWKGKTFLFIRVSLFLIACQIALS